MVRSAAGGIRRDEGVGQMTYPDIITGAVTLAFALWVSKKARERLSVYVVEWRVADFVEELADRHKFYQKVKLHWDADGALASMIVGASIIKQPFRVGFDKFGSYKAVREDGSIVISFHFEPFNEIRAAELYFERCCEDSRKYPVGGGNYVALRQQTVFFWQDALSEAREGRGLLLKSWSIQHVKPPPRVRQYELLG